MPSSIHPVTHSAILGMFGCPVGAFLLVMLSGGILTGAAGLEAGVDGSLTGDALRGSWSVVRGGAAQPGTADNEPRTTNSESGKRNSVLPPVLSLLTNATVDGEGVFLPQIVEASPARVVGSMGDGMDGAHPPIHSSIAPLPNVRVADAPALGQAMTLTRAQVLGVMQKTALELVSSHWVGAERVRITRRSRPLHEAELKEQLTAVLQRDYIKEKGELEIRLLRPWLPMLIPDEPFTVKILDLPTTGVGSHFILRFELNTQRERIGAWQAPLQARVWREIWVARTPLRSGVLLSEADVVRERRDVLNTRDALLPDSLSVGPTAVEVAEAVSAGSPLYLRSVRLRPVVRRGQVIDAQFVDGPMTISLKVEVLENGAPGQLVRVRNLQSKREFKGKVQDEQRIQVVL